MVSSDSSEGSMDENERRFYNITAPSRKIRPPVAAAVASSSPSDSTEKISTPLSNTQPKKPPPKNISNASKPSSSVKRPRETEDSEVAKTSSKKRKATKMEELETKRSIEKKGKKKAVTEAERSAKKSFAEYSQRETVYKLYKQVWGKEEEETAWKPVEEDEEEAQKKRQFEDVEMPGKKGEEEEEEDVGDDDEEQDEDDEGETIVKGNFALCSLKEMPKMLNANIENVEMTQEEEVDEDEEEEEVDVEMTQNEEDEEEEESESDATGNLVQQIADNAMKHSNANDISLRVSNGVVGAVSDGSRTTEESEEESEEEGDGIESDMTEIKGIQSNGMPSTRNRSVAVMEEKEEEDDDGKSESDTEDNKVLHIANGVPDLKPHSSGVVRKQSQDFGPRISNGEQNQCNGNLNNRRRRSADNDIKKLIKLLHETNITIMKNFIYQICKENQDLCNQLKEDIKKVLEEAMQSSSSNRMYDKIQFSSFETIRKISSERSLPALSNKEAKKFKKKWQDQQALELETNIKRMSLLQEELHLRMAKLCTPARK